MQIWIPWALMSIQDQLEQDIARITELLANMPLLSADHRNEISDENELVDDQENEF